MKDKYLIKIDFKYLLNLFKILSIILYNMDSDLVQLINKLSSDLTNSLKTNLTIFVEKNKTNNELLQNLKVLLFKLPEYVELNSKYTKLLSDYDELTKKYEVLKEGKDNITISVNEVKSCKTSAQEVKIVELHNVSNNVINKLTPTNLIKVSEIMEEEVNEVSDEEE